MKQNILNPIVYLMAFLLTSCENSEKNWRANQYNWMIGSRKCEKSTMLFSKHDMGFYGKTLKGEIVLHDSDKYGFSRLHFLAGTGAKGMSLYATNGRDTIHYKDSLDYDTMLVWICDTKPGFPVCINKAKNNKCMLKIGNGKFVNCLMGQ